QLGRLFGYLGLGVFAGFVGHLLNFKNMHPLFSLLPATFIGLLFIFWGVQNFRGKRAEIPVPKILGQLYTRLWFKLLQKNKSFTKAFFTGLISILLPCGLLYGVVLGSVAFQDPMTAFISMFFFWLGTVPSMVAAPGVIQQILRPLKSKLPKTYALTLVTIGV